MIPQDTIHARLLIRLMVDAILCLCIFIGESWEDELLYDDLPGSRSIETHRGCTCDRYLNGAGGR